MPGLRTLHRWSAMLIALFIVTHIVNHLVGLAGYGAHLRFMAVVRPVYRNAVVEPLLLGLLLWQAASGLSLVLRSWRTRRGAVAWLQAGSGIYLLMFLFIHVAAVLNARVHGVDTNVHFAAAGLHVAGWPWFFVPYYSLAIAALFNHVGCALYWHLGGSRRAVLATCVIGGIISGAMIVRSLAIG